MPLVYKCKKCGYVLYDSRNPEKYTRLPGLPTPSEVAAWYDGRCPNCGKPLNTKPDPDKDIIIRITRSLVLKANSMRNIENGGKNGGSGTEVSKGYCNNRHEKRCGAATGKGLEGEAATRNSFQNMESNKK